MLLQSFRTCPLTFEHVLKVTYHKNLLDIFTSGKTYVRSVRIESLVATF